MNDKWKKIVGSVAPALATALGGPLAGLAVKTIAGTVLGDESATEADVEKAILGASPDTLLKLKQADQAFAVQMRELDIDVLELANADRDSARQRETKSGDSMTPRMLAAFVTIGFFGVLYYLMTQGKPELGGDALLVMLGSLGTAWTAIVSYYFGSSAGSKAKTDAMARGSK